MPDYFWAGDALVFVRIARSRLGFEVCVNEGDTTAVVYTGPLLYAQRIARKVAAARVR